MNIFNKLRSRELGLANELTYDFALSRLCVSKQDSWRGISPANYSPDFNPEPPIFSAKFANCDGYRHILAIANEDGKIALQDTTERNQEPEEQSLTAPQCHLNAVFDLEWAPGQMRFVSASGDHTARLWEVTGSGIRGLNSYVGHTRSVKTAAFKRSDPAVFATGGRDGAILIWDIRANLNMDLTSRVDNCIYSGHTGAPGTPQSQRKQRTRTPKVANSSNTSSSITGLAFQDNDTLISCGAGDGVIKVWDLRRNYTAYKKEPLPRQSLPYAGHSTFKGFTNLIVDAAGTRLYANCMDNTIYCYNLVSYDPKPLACYKGLLNSTFYIKSCLSPDGKYLLSGSSDEHAYIWNLEHAAEPLVALSGHTVEVTCVAWGATHDRPIVTCSDDARHKIWRIGPVPETLTAAEVAEQYRGQARYVRQFDKQPKTTQHKYNLRDLESTPRSLKRLMDQNERTPSSVEKTTIKRSFLEMLGASSSDTHTEQPQQKRSKSLESRGRRLFGPTCTSSQQLQLPTIGEELSSMSACNQENATEDTSPISCTSVTGGKFQQPSPLSEHHLNHIPYTSPPTTSAQAAAVTGIPNSTPPASLASLIYSPTSNLPNYVLDGEAPHLGIMSPKRKAKEKVDWLTKIRKQKLMSNSRTTVTLSEKMSNEESPDVLASPRLQSLRNSECSPRLQNTPRRRISHTDTAAAHLRTPTSSRRNSETTLHRFFSVQRSSCSGSRVDPVEDATISGVELGDVELPALSPPPPVQATATLTMRTPTTIVGSD